MKNPIVFFDLETTGINQKTDRIVEIYMLKQNPDGTEEELYSRFNPGIPVPQMVAELHGLDDAMLSMEPKFSERANDVIAFIQGCDLGGYNILSFDIPMLFEEIYRATGKPYDFKKHQIFDSYKIWMKSESRTLTGAVKRYLGKSHDYAHSAKGDVLVTADILKRQLEEYTSQYESIEDMAKQTAELTDRLDFSGKFSKNENNQIIITFGKHKDKTVQQIHSEDSGYLKWIFEIADFPTDTKLIAKGIYDKLQENLRSV